MSKGVKILLYVLSVLFLGIPGPILVFVFIKIFEKKNIITQEDSMLISRIACFFVAAQNIPDKTEFAHCWLNLYKSGAFLCTYLECDRCNVTRMEEQIRKYGRNTEENQNYLREQLNIACFPEGTSYKVDDDFQGFSLTYEGKFSNPSAYKKYYKAILEKCEEYRIKRKENGYGDYEVVIY